MHVLGHRLLGHLCEHVIDSRRCPYRSKAKATNMHALAPSSYRVCGIHAAYWRRRGWYIARDR